MNSYTKVPNDVLLDPTLTPGCRVAYGVLRHLAWKSGRREEADEVALPPLDEIAAAVGCSRSTVATYVAELRRRGLIATRRIGNKGMLYQVFDQVDKSPKSGLVEVRNPDFTGPVAINGSKTTTKDKNYPPTPHDLSVPPPVKLVGGRNLPLDALVETCGVDPEPGNPRVALAVVALNGRARPREPGIRDVFWTECRRQADAKYGGMAAVAALAAFHDDPASFAALLADRIRYKAEKYRAAMPGAMLTPKALRDWWFDVERSPAAAALTARELDRLGNG